MKQRTSKKGSVALAAIATLSILLVISLGIMTLTGNSFFSSDRQRRRTALTAVTEAGIDYGYWKHVWKTQSLPYSASNVTIGPGKFTTSVSDYSGSVDDSFQVTSTGTVKGETMTITRIFPEYTLPAYTNGFTDAIQKITVNGDAKVVDGKLRLTDGGYNQGTTVFHNSNVPIDKFVTEFTFLITDVYPCNGIMGADGFTFCFQSAGPDQVGPVGGGLAFGPDHKSGTAGIPNSVAIKVDTWDNEGEGRSSTGIYFNGEAPTTPSYNLYDDGIDLHSGHVFKMKIACKNKKMTVTLTDTVTLAKSVTKYNVDIPAYIGSTKSYIGFTGSTGGATEIQDILTWTYKLNPNDGDLGN